MKKHQNIRNYQAVTGQPRIIRASSLLKSIIKSCSLKQFKTVSLSLIRRNKTYHSNTLTSHKRYNHSICLCSRSREGMKFQMICSAWMASKVKRPTRLMLKETRVRLCSSLPSRHWTRCRATKAASQSMNVL